jgi:hypothetical protein
MSLTLAYTAGTPTKAAAALFDQLDKALKSEGEELVQKTKVGAAVCCQLVRTVCFSKGRLLVCGCNTRTVLAPFTIHAGISARATCMEPQQQPL